MGLPVTLAVRSGPTKCDSNVRKAEKVKCLPSKETITPFLAKSELSGSFNQATA